jgi:hypothetical protein
LGLALRGRSIAWRKLSGPIYRVSRKPCAIPVLGDRERIVRKPDGVCRSYAAAPDAALQPKRKSCDLGVILDTLGVAGAFGEEARAGGAFFRERPRQRELGLEHRAGALDHAVQRRRHPTFYWMEHPPPGVVTAFDFESHAGKSN